MASQFYGLNIAYTGLLASNAALNTSANNIANVETEGYSRQQVTQTAAEALRSYTTFGCMGAGVDVSNVERVRDEFFDRKFWENNKNLGEYDKKAYYMNQIQDYFIDDDYVKGFTSVFGEFY
ncbi:MAG: flagellar hook-associated protein FlgK, partial [Lachnospiraceae bacterium]|nr:flagellar hook-associated protein FlgK [Lachnospiraceae bacterium]